MMPGWLIQQPRGRRKAMLETDPALAKFADNHGVVSRAIGHTLSYHISQCKDGGYVILVDGVVKAARTTLHEAVAQMGQYAAGQFGESPTPPEDADDVTPVEREPIPGGGPRIVHPPKMPGAHARATAVTALMVLTAWVWAVAGVRWA